MKKKFIIFILSLITCFTFVSCGDSNKTDTVDSSGILNEESSESSIEGSVEDSELDKEDSSESERQEVSVTFQQNGVEDIIITLTKGSALTDVPVPVEKMGYTVVWDRTDFSNITKDITVKAIETAKTYTVKLQANGGSVAQETLIVTYGQAYELPAPVHSEHIFACWTYAGKTFTMQGVWELDLEEITLIAKWNECYWSGNY